MKKRIVVTGAGGMLGKLCVAHFQAQPHCEVIPLTRQKMDMEDDASIRKTLDAVDFFEVLINCAAWTDVDACETDPKKADQINGYAVGLMGQIAADRGAHVIHIGTDYVFDGTKTAPYVETDEPNPVSAYGSSKLTGEEELFDAFPEHLVIRVSWLFGPGKQGFPEWILRQALAKDQVNVVTDKTGSPTFAPDVVAQLDSFVFSEEPVGGILHMSNTGSCSWKQWGQHCLDVAAASGLPLKTTKLGGITMEELSKLASWKAKRPLHSTLDPSRLATTTGIPIRSWQDSVSEFVASSLVPALASA